MTRERRLKLGTIVCAMFILVALSYACLPPVQAAPRQPRPTAQVTRTSRYVRPSPTPRYTRFVRVTPTPGVTWKQR